MATPVYGLWRLKWLCLGGSAFLLLAALFEPSGMAVQRGGHALDPITRVQDAVQERIRRTEGGDVKVYFNTDANQQFQSTAEHRVTGTGDAQKRDRQRNFYYEAIFNIRDGNVYNVRLDWRGGWRPGGSGGGGGGGGGGGNRPNGRVRYSGGIRNAETGKVLDVRDFSRDDGGMIQQWSYANQPNQRFDVIDVGRGQYAIANQNSNKVLDVAGFSNQNGGQIQQYRWTGNDNQRWRVEPSGGGYNRIVSVSSGKCIDVRQKSTRDGAVIHQWDCNGDRSQNWSIGN